MALDVGELVARIRLDGLREFENDQRRAETSFRDLGRQADRSTSGLGQGFQDARRDVTQLADTTSRSGASMRQDLQRTEQTGQQSANTIGNAFRDSMRSAGDGMRSELQTLAPAASSAGGESGGGFAAAFSGRIAALGSKAGPIAAALVGVAAIGVVAGKALADAVEQGFELQKGRDFSAAKFGLNPAQMEQAGQAAGNAYGNAWGESVQANIDTAGIGIQSGLIKPGASAAEMQPIIEKLTMVSDIMGTEIPETARAAGQMIKTGLVQDGAAAFDLLTAAQQKGLNISDDLLDTVNEYGTQYRKLGLTGETALGTIAQMMQGGARDSDIAADALKEFSLRVVDLGNKDVVGAFETLQLNAVDTAAEFGKGGAAAAKMADTVIDKLRAVKDPVERNTLGVALFGTQWEDLGGAINNMDLSNAAGQLGQVDGAAGRAGDTMNNAANSMTAAKNKISVAADNVKLKLGEAFAPAAMDLGNWVTEHQDQIVDFFKAAADGALIFTEGMLQVTAVGADMAAAVMRYGANFLDYFTIPILNGIEQVGSVMSHLPGSAGKMGASIRDAAKTAHDSLGDMRDGLRGGADGLSAAADGARNFSDKIDGARQNLMGLGDAAKGSTNPAIQTTTQMVQGLTGELNKLPRNVPINVETPGGQTALNLLQSLGIQTHVDNNKNIVVDAPMAPAVLSQLQALGVSVRTDNGKTILVTDNNTATVTKDKIDAIARERRIAYIDVMERQNYTQSAQTAPNGVRAEQGPGLYAAPRASGGRVGGSGGPRADDQLIWASSPEWVIQSSAAQKYGPAAMNAVNNGTAHIMAFANGGPVGQPAAYGLPAGSTGGFPSWVNELGAQYGVKPSTYAGHQESSRNEPGYAPNPQGLNRGIDWGGSTAQMQAFAEAMYARAQSDTAIEQIIWQNPQTGQKIGWHGRSPDTDGSYFASDYAGHTDHVHLRVAAQVGAGAAAGATGQPGVRSIPLTKNPDGTWTSTDPAWAALIKRESGGNASIVQGINDVNSGGNEASGLFQIAKGTWASNGGAEFGATAGEATPENQAIVAARIFDKSGGNPWGAGLSGRENEDALRAGITEMGAAGGPNALAASGPAQNVFVTNWPSNLGSGSSSTSVNVSSSGGSSGSTGKSSVESATSALESAKRKQVDAAGAIRVAEAKLSDVKKSGKVSAGALAAAEEKAAKARRAGQAAADGVTEAEKKLKDARSKKATDTPAETQEARDTRLGIKGRGPIPVVAYAQGGFGDAPDKATMLNGAKSWMTLAGEAGPEAYIPINNSPRSMALWMETGKRLGAVKAYAAGGFGGYTKDTTDAMKPKNWYDWAALGVGGAFAVESIAEPYIGMATGKQISLGDLSPTADLGNNTSGAANSALTELGSGISKQIEDLIKAVREGKDIHVTVNSRPDTGPAAMLLGSKGM